MTADIRMEAIDPPYLDRIRAAGRDDFGNDLGLSEDADGSDAKGTLPRLHARLLEQAARQDLLDVSYRTLESPLGTLLLAATPAGLVRVAYECEGIDAVLVALADRVGPRILEAPGPLDRPARQIEEYLRGTRRRFDLPVDLRLSAGFRRKVLDALPDIPYGTTTTYRSVAEAVENPRAVRAVGTACATNPLPIVVPCHRVIRSDGEVGAYLGGPEMKRRLLALEAVTD